MNAAAAVDEDFVKDYATSLDELTTNSKPHINMLTLLADEGQIHADKIVELIENRIYKVDKSQKLPLLYLIDSILKNCSDGPYREKFAKNIINVFAHVFSKADDEKIRGSMFKLRETWNAIFPTTKLLFLDMKINGIDPAWPLRLPSGSATSSRVVIPPAPTPAAAAPPAKTPTSIHLNPKFLNKSDDVPSTSSRVAAGGDPRTTPRTTATTTLQKKPEPIIVQKSREIVKETVQTKDTHRIQSVVRPVNSALLNAVKERSSKELAARKTPKIDENTKKDNINNNNNNVLIAENSKKIAKNNINDKKFQSIEKKSNESSSSSKRDDSMIFAFDHTPKRRLAHESNTPTISNQSKISSAPSREPPTLIRPPTFTRPPTKILKPSPKIATHNIEEEEEEEEEEAAIRDVMVALEKPAAPPKDEDYRNFAQMPRRKTPANLRQTSATDSSPEETTTTTEKRKISPTENVTSRKGVGDFGSKSKGDVDLRFGIGAAQTSKPTSNVEPNDDNLPFKKRRRGLDETPPKIVHDASTSSSTSFRRPLLSGKPPIGQKIRPTAMPPRQQQQQQPLLTSRFPQDVGGGNVRRTAGGNIRPAPTETPAPLKRPLRTTLNAGGGFGNVPEIPSNNMIYVDGVEYPVGYVDRQPVIKKHGNVHRLHFSGLGRHVTIDDRKYFLKFDEQKEVLIDGHLHKIRFGGPSRELYMNDFPFRGSFGGAPIFATINGLKHKILLAGPAPEVKIDLEPAYDLKNVDVDFGRHSRPGGAAAPARQIGPLPANFGYSFAGSAPVAPYPQQPLAAAAAAQVPASTSAFYLPQAAPLAGAPAAPKPAVNVADLLNKLVTTGFIAPKQPAAAPAPEPKPSTARVNSKAASTIPTYEDPTLAAVDLSSLDLPILKRRYASIIRALYKDSGFVCAHCGVRFDESRQQKYANHLDWHFNQSKFAGSGANDRRRKWYLVDDDWANYEEFRDDKTPKAKSKIFESEAKKRKSKEEKVVSASTNSVIIADDEHNTCAVCFERFEQFWDEEEETWKLRNAVLVDDTAYHPLCYEDTLNISNINDHSTIMETKKKKKIQTSDKKLESKQEISDQDLELEKLARDQLLKEAKRGAVRAQTMGSQGWLKPKIPPPNKQFLQRTLASSVITKKESDWANYEEFRDDKTPKAKSKIFESEAKKRKSKEEKVVSASTNSVIIADDEHNTCAVCFERFEQFWDEEEETWKLRNAVLVDDTAYHPLCYEDTLNISNINDHSTIMETKKKKKIQTSDGKLESKQQISDQDLELEKLARDQLLREAKRGAVRAQTMGSQGWLKPKVPPPNKRFLQRSLASAAAFSKKKSVKSLTKDSSTCKS